MDTSDKIFFSIVGAIVLLLASWGSYTMYTALRHESLQQQQERLTQEVWKLQDQFNLRTGSVRVEVRRGQDMLEDGKPCGCWGYGNYIENGDYSIAIEAMEDMPQAQPWAYRRQFQNEILQHEVMHIVLTALEVPAGFQDRLIKRLQPSLREP